MAINSYSVKLRQHTMMSMWSQSAPQLSMRSASDAKLAKSDDNIDGAIFAVTPIFFFCFGWIYDTTRPDSDAHGFGLFLSEKRNRRDKKILFFFLVAS